MKRGWFATLLAVFLLVVGVSSCQGEDRLVEKPIIYVGASLNSDEETTLAKNFLKVLSDELDGAQQIDIDFMRGEVVDNAYSQSADPWAIYDVIGKIESEASSDQAIAAAFQRVIEWSRRSEAKPVVGFILTPGTANSTTLQSFTRLSQELVKFPQTHVFVVGVSKENRIPLSEAFEPIRERVDFASSASSEWLQIVDYL